MYWGDNESVMVSLLKDFSNKINLIYFDPPFATGGTFNFKIYIGGQDNSNKPKRWINKKAYSDAWKGGIIDYLNFMHERLFIMRELLSEEGSIYVHLDWHIGHYVKILMDEIFGVENFRNEIIWAYPAASVQTRRFFMRSFDVILFYTKSDKYVFNDNPNIYMEYSDRVKKALKKDEKGTYYHRGGSHDGKKLSQKVYIKNEGTFPRDVWNDIPYVRANTIEYQGFSTQKPERLLKRIILASTNENDIVVDFFCGSGTTLAVAEKLNRRWIGCDLTRHAIHITRKRLLDIKNGNDILKWKKIYDKNIRPFKIMSVKEDIEEDFISIEFLLEEHGNYQELKKLGKPSFQLNIRKEKKKVFIELTNYEIPYLDSISKEVVEKINTWSDWIDYFSVDFNKKSTIFNTQWVSYRTPKNRNIDLSAGPYLYEEAGTYNIAVKVVNILGTESVQVNEINIE